mmetsp:Transcript_10230/g.23060  ORF Transcript_10230/g.23060 Transcript_10230/m.23060 type:complete len:215 (-) Transcript_10230:105-749(-)
MKGGVREPAKEVGALQDVDASQTEEQVEQHNADESHATVPQPKLPKGVKLLEHELQLVKTGELHNITHAGASSVWLWAASAEVLDEEASGLVYRPMADTELNYLLQHRQLPDTQPYQTIVEGRDGREYAEKYLRGHKSVDTSPTTVVEFMVPRVLIDLLWAMQSKNEDGAISHGLGNKGGKGLPHFNQCLQEGLASFRIVLVKRPAPSRKSKAR